MNRVTQLSGHLKSPGKDAEREVVYIANRGIVALRILRTCKRMNFHVVGGYCASDSKELFVRSLHESFLLSEEDGPSAYMNIDKVIALAKRLKAKYIHPGIGLLSESPEFAHACAASGLIFVGPSPSCLQLFGNKVRSSELAQQLNIPTLSLGKVLRTSRIEQFPVLFKASNGGGGMGLRVVNSQEEVQEQYDRCLSEAVGAFGGSPEILCEVYLPTCRHVEVQVVGNGVDIYFTLGDRECSVQRKFQKVVEIAPCPFLSESIRQELHRTALLLARETQYCGVGTFEFLVPTNQSNAFYFMECNPRLQVEHTVTEEIFAGLDLVRVQMNLAARVALNPSAFQRRAGFAIQCRICAEEYNAKGELLPSSGSVSGLDFPRGSGIRVEVICDGGGGLYEPNLRFDSLLAQLIVYTPDDDFPTCVSNTLLALEETRVYGCSTNVNVLLAILGDVDFQQGKSFTRFLEERLPLYLSRMPSLALTSSGRPPLAAAVAVRPPFVVEKNMLMVSAPMRSSVVNVLVKAGDAVYKDKTVLLVLTVLKMEHEIRSTVSGQVRAVKVKRNDSVQIGDLLVEILLNQGLDKEEDTQEEIEDTPSQVFADFQAKATYATTDSARPEKVQQRIQGGRLTARQVLDRIFDKQESRLELGRLAWNGYQKHSVGDGLYVVKGFMNHHPLRVHRPKAMVVIYDFTVLAGTQGLVGHKKKDRAFELALQDGHPIVLFAEGGGGRAGDAKKGGFTSTGLDGPAFTLFAKLSVAKVPLVGAVSGFCFAGNAALLGTCDVIVASVNDDTSIGMGGPAMIEGGGLGSVEAKDVGPVLTHYHQGVVDILVQNDAELVDSAKHVLSYFQGPCLNWTSRTAKQEEEAQKRLRKIVPTKNRRLAFSMMDILKYVLDLDSVLELKAGFAPNLHTCLGRMEGKPVGIIANNCSELSGTLDALASLKAAKFLSLCNKHGLPLLSFCDTPGFLVGVESEKQGLVKLAGDLFIAGASLRVPLICVVIRRCVGLGGQAMCGGDIKVPYLTVSWPTGEFGAMGIEGAVKLGFREEIANNPKAFDVLVEKALESGRAVNVAGIFEIDDVIDPADTRHVILNALTFAQKE